MKKQKIVLTAATIVAFISLFVISCKKELVSNDENYKSNLLDYYSGNSGSPTSITANWDNWTNGDNYNVAMANTDFGNIHNFTQVEQARTLISLSRLRVTLLKNEYGAAGGVITNTDLSPKDGFEINFKVKFHSTFDFTQNGGRCGWGLDIGDGASGVADGNGGSFRLAWDTDANGNPYLKPYIYYADMTDQSQGADFGARYPASGSITGSVWYEVKMVFKANSNMDRNGRAQLYINNTEVLNVPIRWTLNNLKRKANSLLFSNYRSGSGSQSNIDCNMWFDDFSLTSSTPTYTPTWVDNNVTVDSAFDQPSQTMYYVTIVKNLSSTQLKMALADQSWGEVGDHFARRLDAAVVLNASMGIDTTPPHKRPVGKQVINNQIASDRFTKNFTLGIKDNNTLVDYDTPTSIQTMIADGSQYALTGFSPLIKNYQSVVDSAIMKRMTNYDDKNPRQTIGQLGNGDIIILSTAGRNKGGTGVVVGDVIRLLQTYNTKYSFMLDGGGSVQTIVNGKIMTRLIDTAGTALRARPNFLYIPYPHNPTGD